MSDASMSKKSAVIFDFLDVEKDGILRWTEMKTFPLYLKNTVGKEKLARDLETVYRDVWTRIHASLGQPESSDSISREHFIKGANIVRKTSWFQETFVQSTTDIYFDSMDPNGDGVINLDEWREFYKARGVTDEAFIKKTFNKLDADGNGEITRMEFKEAFAKSSVSEDPNNDFAFIYDINKVNQ